MLNRPLSVFAFLTLLSLPVWAQDHERVQGQDVAPHEVLVKFRPATATARIAAEAGADVDVAQRLGAIDWARWHSRSKDAATLVRELSSHPDVIYAEPNFIVHATAIPNDPRFGELWGLQNTGQIIGGQMGIPGADISAVPAWDISTGSRANVVAVIDTGIDYTHPDLDANVWSAPISFTVNLDGTPVTCAAGTHGFNVITNTCDSLDDNNHGTHVSGTVGAVGNNDLGVVGVNWTASIMGSKFLNAFGSGTLADAIKAIEFVVQAKTILGSGANVRVLSNSWGGGGFSQALLDEINRAHDNDMLFVATAGGANTNIDDVPFYPASYNTPGMVTATATDNRDAKAPFANYGKNTVHLGAPGVNILSTIRGASYVSFSGTSMATPHVAGAAALVLSQCSLDTVGLKTNILNNIDPIDSLSGITITGGRLNVNGAIRDCTKSPLFTLTASPDTVDPGDPLTVQWTAREGRPAMDWIGLYHVGDPNTAYVSWAYTGGATSGSLTFSAPDSGQYEFRYLLDGGFNDITRSNTVNVR